MAEKMDIELAKVSFAYNASEDRTMLFDHIFQAGSFTAVMGPSGSGKSTLLSLIAGFEVAASGQIRFNRSDLTSAPPASRPVSLVFQENNLFSHLDAFKNVALGISPSLKLDATQSAEVILSLEKVGLEGKEGRLPAELSGGERQRVALARVLVRQKPVLLLDEAFASLGPGLRSSMLALVKRLHVENSLTTIMVTHSPDDALAVSDRIAFIDQGTIVETGETRSILENALANDALSHYLSADEDKTSK